MIPPIGLDLLGYKNMTVNAQAIQQQAVVTNAGAVIMRSSVLCCLSFSPRAYPAGAVIAEKSDQGRVSRNRKPPALRLLR